MSRSLREDCWSLIFPTQAGVLSGNSIFLKPESGFATETFLQSPKEYDKLQYLVLKKNFYSGLSIQIFNINI